MPENARIRQSRGKVYLEVKGSNGWSRVGEIGISLKHSDLLKSDLGDDHKQYHNNDRGDGRYYQSSKTIEASKISLSTQPITDYKSVEDWINNTQASGKISGGTFVDNTDGTVTVGQGTGFIRASNSDIATVKFFKWLENTNVSLTDNATNYIYVKKTGDGFTISSTVTKSDANNRNIILLGKIYRNGTELHMVDAGMTLSEATKRTLVRFTEVAGEVVHADGYRVTEKNERYITTDAGVLFGGLTKITTSGIDTTGGDTFITFYYDGVAETWIEGSASQVDNLQWNNTTLAALQTLTANRYGVFWVYGDYDGHVAVVYGQGDYKLPNAEAATQPLALPAFLTSFGFLAAKIIIKKSDPNFYFISSAYEKSFAPSGGDITDPNAIHDNTVDEIHQITNKETPVDADEIVTEDSAASWAKKRVSKSNLLKSVDRDHFVIPEFDGDEVVAIGDGTKYFTVPSIFNGWKVVDFICGVTTKGVTNTTDVQLRKMSNVGAEVDILSDPVTIADEYFASDGTIKDDDSELIATGDRIYMDVDAVHDTPPSGLQGTIVLNPP